MSQETRTTPARRIFAATFAVSALALLAAGYKYTRVEAERLREEQRAVIAAIGGLKFEQIQHWRTERRSDARRAAHGPYLMQDLALFLRDPGGQDHLATLRKHLEVERMEGVYAVVLLLAPDGQILISTDDSPPPVDPATQRAVEAALASREAVLSDFFRAPDGSVAIDVAAAVGNAEGRPLAVVVLRSHAATYLYPLIQSWPTPSGSAETLLVQREGEEVVFLNDLRHRSESALSLRLPMTRTDVPAVQAALGRQGAFEGRDYRDVEVMADLRSLPGSPWFLVAKVDREEILAEARRRAILIALFVGAFVLLVGTVTAYAYRRRQVGLLRDLYDSELTAQAKLRDAEGRYRRLFEQSPYGVLLVDAETGRVIEANERAAEQLGYSREEFAALQISDWEAAEKPEETAERMQAILRHGSDDFDTLHRTKSGEIRNVHIWTKTLRVGDRACFYAIFQDVTERKRAEAELQSARELLEAIRQAQASFLASANTRGTFEQLLQTLLAVTGSEYGFIGEVLRQPDGTPFLKTHAITNIAWTPHWLEFYEKNAPQGLEFYNLQTLFGAVITSGRPVIANDPATDPRRGGLPPDHPGMRAFLGLPFFNADELVGMVGIANRQGGYDQALVDRLAPFLSTCASLIAAVRLDRQRQRAEAELRLQGAALNVAADTIIITDRDGTIEYVNPAFTALTGYGAEEARSRSPRDLLESGVHDQAFYEQLWDTLLAGQVWQGEITNRRKDGSRYPQELTITPVPDACGEIAHFIAIGRDLTEPKRLEAQYLQAQKMESVGRLAGGIAHDFNNLLTVINGRAELVSTGLAEGDPLRADVAEIHQAGERATALTRQLLAFSRKQVLKPEVLNLSTLVGNLQSMHQRLLGEDIALVVVPAHEVGCVRADPGQLEQVILNLSVNARDAMPTGGTLRIETRNVELDEAFAARQPSLVPGPHVMVTVSDTGVGMDEATRLRIFEPFFTTKEAGKGTGLGLATAYGIVTQSGGAIWVDSEPGRGTTFTICLPRVEEVAQTAQPARVRTVAPGTETILLVEDEAAVLRLAERILRAAGYTVLAASTSEEGLLELERHAGPVHLLLTDLVMPQIGGWELACRAGKLRPGLTVLYMSGYGEGRAFQEVLEAGAPLLRKPFSAESLARAVREVLDARAERS